MAFDTRSVTALVLEGEDNASAAFDAVAASSGSLGGALTGLAAGGLMIAATGLITAGAAAFSFSQQVQTSMQRVEAQTGLTGGALADFEAQAKDVFENNWGDNFADVAEAMSTVQRITQTAGEELEGLTQSGLILRDVFEADVTQSARAVNTAMENFGVAGQDAFDLITTAFQRTGDPAGDLLDTVNEYAADFAEAGFSADDMFSTLIAGAESGVFNLDKVADSVREFSTRLIDNSAPTRAALDSLGIGADALYERFAAGTVTTQDALAEVGDALRAIEDPIARDAAGVALFGSMWEDLGEQAILGIADATGALDGVEGATERAGDAVSRGLMPALSSLWRQLMLDLEPVGDAIGDVINGAIPYLSMFGDWLGVVIPAAIDTLMGWWQQLVDLLPAFNLDSLSSAYGPIVLLQTGIEYLVESFRLLFEGDVDSFAEGISQGFGLIQNALGLSGDAATAAFDAIINGVTAAGEFLRGVWDGVILPIFDSLTGTLEGSVMPAIGRLVEWIGSWLPDAVATAGDFLNTQLLPAVTAIAGFISEHVIPAIGALAGWLIDHLPAALEFVAGVVADILVPAMTAAGEIVRGIWNGVLLPLFNSLRAVIEDTVLPAIMRLAEWVGSWLPAAMTTVSGAMQTASAFIREHLLAALTTAAGFIAETVIPAIGNLVAWLMDNLPVAVEAVSGFVQERLLPALDAIWVAIQENVVPILTELSEWLQTNVPVAIEAARDAWETVLKPALETVWEFITESVLPAIGDIAIMFLEEMPRAIEKLREGWEEVIKPALQTVWEFITEDVIPALTTVWQWLSETLPAAATTLATAFDEKWTAVKNAVQGAWDIVGDIFRRIREFIEWVTGQTISINFQWPELPDWMTPGSPIKLHTLMMDWQEWLKANEFTMRTNWQDGAPGASGAGSGDLPILPLPAGGNQSGTVINFNAPITISDRQTGDAFMEFLRLRQDVAALTTLAG